MRISFGSLKGTYLKLDYRSMMKFKLAVPENTEHAGGVTLFGKAFENYNQNIDVCVDYSAIKSS